MRTQYKLALQEWNTRKANGFAEEGAVGAPVAVVSDEDRVPARKRRKVVYREGSDGSDDDEAEI